MRCFSILVFACCFCVAPVYAQHFYVKAGIGYGLPQSYSHPLHISGYPYIGYFAPYDRPELVWDNREHASLFAGIMGEATLGYHISAHWAVTLGVKAALSRNTYSYTLDLGPDGFIKSTNYSDLPVIFAPGATYTMREWKGLSAYLQGSICLPLRSHIYTDVDELFRGTRIIQHSETSTAFAIGFTGGIGVRYRSKGLGNLMLFCEGGVTALSLPATSTRLTECTQNGVDLLPQLEEYRKAMRYSSDYSVYKKREPDKPVTVPPYRVPCSNLGLSIGIDISL